MIDLIVPYVTFYDELPASFSRGVVASTMHKQVKKKYVTRTYEPHQGGRHPFNILTEEIYND